MKSFKTQFENMKASEWLKGWQFWITKSGEVLIFNHGYFLYLDQNDDLAIYNGYGVYARLTLTQKQKDIMRDAEILAMQQQANTIQNSFT